jgi:hypothetical protein
VRVTDDTAIFDENGEFGGRELLERGQQVKVRGRLDDDGKLMASVVVIGQVLVVKGEVDGPLDDATGLFPFTPFPGDQRDVAVADETLILIGCDTEVGKGAIQAGMTAKVVGKVAAKQSPLSRRRVQRLKSSFQRAHLSISRGMVRFPWSFSAKVDRFAYSSILTS